MIHEDGTMDVRLSDGTTERRPYSINIDKCRGPGWARRLPRYEPELRDGEQAVWTIGDLTPTVIRIRDPEPDQPLPTFFDPEWR